MGILEGLRDFAVEFASDWKMPETSSMPALETVRQRKLPKPYIPPNVAAQPSNSEIAAQPGAMTEDEASRVRDASGEVPYMGGANATMPDQVQTAPNFTPVPVTKTDNPAEQQPYAWLLNQGTTSTGAPAGTQVKDTGIYKQGNSYTNVGPDGKPTAESQKSKYPDPEWLKRDKDGNILPGQKDSFGNWMRPETAEYIKQVQAARAAGRSLYEGATYGLDGKMLSGPRTLLPPSTISPTPQTDASAQIAENNAIQQSNSLRALPTSSYMPPNLQRRLQSQDWANKQMAQSGVMGVMPRVTRASKSKEGTRSLKDFPAAPPEITQSLKPIV